MAEIHDLAIILFTDCSWLLTWVDRGPPALFTLAFVARGQHRPR